MSEQKEIEELQRQIQDLDGQEEQQTDHVRERAAIAAMQGLLVKNSEQPPEYIASRAVEYADALVERLETIHDSND